MKKNSCCILFAAYNEKDIVDSIDIETLKALSQLGDVHYFADNSFISDKDIEKISEFSETVKFMKHGEYDFGSWKRLIQYLDDKLEKYDEFIIVNNSIIIVNDIKHYLERFKKSDAEFFATLLLDEHYTGQLLHKDDYLKVFSPYHDSVMFPSFFWCFKKELFFESWVQFFFKNIKLFENRLEVCLECEREFSRSIFRHNVKYSLMTDTIYKNSCFYTAKAFQLVKEGIPFFKKKVLAQTFYEIKDIEACVDGMCKKIIPNYAVPVHSYLTRKLSAIKKQKKVDLSIEAIVDKDWYYNKYEDVKNSKIDPVTHYVKNGWKEGRSPNSWFDLKKYIYGFPDITQMQFLAFLGYLENNFQDDFDAKFYLKKYPDVQKADCTPEEHFLSCNVEELRDPNGNFSSAEYINENPELLQLKIIPFFHFIQDKEISSYVIEQKTYAKNFSSAKKLIIFFNVAKDLIGGGMLSIDRFCRLSSELFANDANTKVVISGVPLTNKSVKYSFFSSFLNQVEFTYIVEQCDPDEVYIFLPEVYSTEFAQQLSKKQFSWLCKRKDLNIIIMNQNNDLMPSPYNLQTFFEELPCNMLMSTAHKKYCNELMAACYHMPVKQLTPILPTTEVFTFEKKKKIFLLSDDDIRGDTKKTKEEIINALKKEFSDFKFITIESMHLNKYLRLTEEAMFSITFGEGMDGYFVEPIRSGGVSFAVFNETFFPAGFEKFENVYRNWDEFVNNIIKDLKFYINNPPKYNQQSAILREEIAKHFCKDISLKNLKDLYLKNYDFDTVSREHAKTSYFETPTDDFCKVLENGAIQTVYTPFILANIHTGMYLNYHLTTIEKYDFKQFLNAKEDYVFIDTRAMYGLLSFDIMAKHSNIVYSYLYESSFSSYTLLKNNIKFSAFKDKINLNHTAPYVKNAKFYTKYCSELAPIFSPIGQYSSSLEKDYKVLFDHLDFHTYRCETVALIDELKKISLQHKTQKKILHINMHMCELDIINHLDESCYLSDIHILVIDLFFVSYTNIVDLLEKNNFKVVIKTDNRFCWGLTVLIAYK